jgi:probable F420-dependent oxidoreductase
MTETLSGTGIWSAALRYGDAGEAAVAVAELEGLGYSAAWIPDVGGDVFGAVENLLSATQSITVATGILNIWMHTPDETAEHHARLTGLHGDRFLVGLGVSHAPLIDRVKEAGAYRKPLAHMVAFLDGLDGAPEPLAKQRRAIAALGPKMLELAGARTAGTHPYLVTPQHTFLARQALGSDALVATEQAVALTTDPVRARELGRMHLSGYLALPNYANNWRRLGFDESDLADGGSDTLVDGLVAWGDETAIGLRVKEHRDAGANHVCIQVLTDDRLALPRDAWRTLAPALVD